MGSGMVRSSQVFRSTQVWRHVTAFTLVELMVVVGVVGVLLAILLPTISRARSRASQTQCASQLHQLGIALAGYAAEHHGWLPAWSGWHVYPPGSPEDDPGEAWTEQLAPDFVLPNSPVYTCPSFNGPPWVTYFLSGRWSQSQGRNAMRLSEIRFGPQFVLGGEETNRHLYAPPFGDDDGHTTDDCDKDDANAPGACFPGDDGGFLEHPGGNNLLFGDLHVEAFKRDDPTALTFAANAMRPWADVTPPSDPADPASP